MSTKCGKPCLTADRSGNIFLSAYQCLLCTTPRAGASFVLAYPKTLIASSPTWPVRARVRWCSTTSFRFPKAAPKSLVKTALPGCVNGTIRRSIHGSSDANRNGRPVHTTIATPGRKPNANDGLTPHKSGQRGDASPGRRRNNDFATGRRLFRSDSPHNGSVV